MDRRITRILVLGFACLWFGMLVPIHQRGQIKLPGSCTAVASSEGSTTAMAKPCSRGGPDAPCRGKAQQLPATPDDEPAPHDDGACGSCAVCHFIAGLDAPPPVTLGVAPLGFLEARPLEHVPTSPARHAALPFHGLDPPLA